MTKFASHAQIVDNLMFVDSAGNDYLLSLTEIFDASTLDEVRAVRENACHESARILLAAYERKKKRGA